jgi:limonene-1,2-epoxide hydrolase
MTEKIKFLLFYSAPIIAGLLAGCASPPKQDPMVFTAQALAATDAGKVKLSGAAEEEAIKRFETFNGDISAANITNNLRKIYINDIYFRDPFKEIHGIPGLETYLLRDSASVSEYSMDWKDVGKSDGDYYFRWVMEVRLKRDSRKKPPVLACGISEVRFGADGRVIFEQDYFDAASFLYERLPIIGGEIRFIKKRL